MGKQLKAARWFVAHSSMEDDEHIVVRGFMGYTEALNAFQATLLVARQGHPPGFDPGVDLVDFQGRILLSSSTGTLGRADYVKQLRRGSMLVRFDDTKNDFVQAHVDVQAHVPRPPSIRRDSDGRGLTT